MRAPARSRSRAWGRLCAGAQESPAEKKARSALERIRHEDSQRRSVSEVKSANKVLEKVRPVLASIAQLQDSCQSLAPAMLANVKNVQKEVEKVKERATKVVRANGGELFDMKELRIVQSLLTPCFVGQVCSLSQASEQSR